MVGLYLYMGSLATNQTHLVGPPPQKLPYPQPMQGLPSSPPPSKIVIGEPAPEIEGEDVDGVRFKLSEYKGKVVLLDFWGHW